MGLRFCVMGRTAVDSGSSLEQTPASIATTIGPILRTHQNLPHPLLITDVSLKTKNTSLPILICPLLPTSPRTLPVSAPNTIHHSRLTVYLPDSLDLTCCLS